MNLSVVKNCSAVAKSLLAIDLRVLFGLFIALLSVTAATGASAGCHVVFEGINSHVEC